MIAQSAEVDSENSGKPPRPRFSREIEQLALELPPGKRLGSIVGLARTADGELFLLQDVIWAVPKLAEQEMLPPVIHIDAEGRFLNAWGGPDQLPAIDGMSQWPTGLDNIECDSDGNIWVFGYGQDDHAAAKFTPDGTFIKQLGRRGKRGGLSDTEFLGGPVSVWMEPHSRELFIADGYANNRIISFNADNDAFIRMWGAYGKPPSPPVEAEYDFYGDDPTALPPPPPTFGVPVHRVIGTPDGRLYIADRPNSRIQEFDVSGDEVRYVREVVVGPGTLAIGNAWDVNFSPDLKFMYVADVMNMRIWIVDRGSFEVLGWTSAVPAEGDDNVSTHRSGIHRILVEPNGDILIARTTVGLQRLKFLGIR